MAREGIELSPQTVTTGKLFERDGALYTMEHFWTNKRLGVMFVRLVNPANKTDRPVAVLDLPKGWHDHRPPEHTDFL